MRLFKICMASVPSGEHGLCHAAQFFRPLLCSRRSAAVDFGGLSRSQGFPTAMALKQQLMPDNIKQFEVGAQEHRARSRQRCGHADLRLVPRRQARRQDGRRGRRPLQHEGRAEEDEAAEVRAQEVRQFGNLSDGRRLRHELPRRQHAAVRRLDLHPRRARYPRWSGSGSGYQRQHGRHDVERRLRARSGAFSTRLGRRT